MKPTRLGISPWNAPIYLAIRAIAIPLICGNTVILKSSEHTPRTQSIVVEALVEVRSQKDLIVRQKLTYSLQAGAPKGVVNYISMDRDQAPALTAEMIGHPLVRRINVRRPFTRSPSPIFVPDIPHNEQIISSQEAIE